MNVSLSRHFSLGMVCLSIFASLSLSHSARAVSNPGPTGANLSVLGTNGVSAIASGAAATRANGTDFGVNAPGSIRTNTLYLWNNGDGSPLIFSSITTNGTGFTITGIPSSVAYNAKVPFTVVYGSATVGSNAADLVININATAATGIGVNYTVPTAYTIKLAGMVTSATPVYEISTNCGPFAGGNTITITNGTFGNITNVLVGGVKATITGSGATWFTITLPATGAAGVKDIVVQTSDNGDITLAGAYTVNPAGVIGGGAEYVNVWTNLSSGVAGLSQRVYSLAYEGANLYAGGSFASAGGVSATNIAKWDGTTWTNLGSGMNNLVMVLKTVGTDVYAAGDFTNAGGVAGTKYIAKWNGAAWESLAGGMSFSMNALESDGTNLYAGGAFTNAGGVTASHVAKWNGSTWTNLGSGVSGGGDMVWAMAHDGTNLYAGGSFITAGSVSATNIAKWNGSAWTSLGNGLPGVVLALAWNGSNLYAGGSFTNVAGNTNSKYVALWNGTTWTNLGSGMNGGVNALAHDGTNLYAGGTFTTAGGVSALKVAMWNGTAWTNLGSGCSSTMRALAHDGASLYAGGNSGTVGGMPLISVAKWGPMAISSGAAITPSSGVWTGGYPVVISGVNLGNGSDITGVTLGGASASISSQTVERVWIVAGQAVSAGLGDVRVFSTSFGETVKGNAFEYLRSAQAPLVFSPTSPQAYAITNAFSVSGGSGTGAVSYAVLSGPGQIVGLTNLLVTSGTGTIQVLAQKAQDALYFATSVTSEVVAVKGTQTISFPAIADQLTTNRVALVATASSGLTPAFSVTSGPAVIIGLTSLTFTGAGSVSIVARQTGDTNWNAAASVTNTFTVRLADQAALTFSPASPQTYGTTNSLTALEPSGIGLFGVLPPSGIGTGAVSYAVQSGPGAIVESNLLTVTSGTGSVVVVATKAADVLYNARSATATVVCAKAGQVITFDAIDNQFWTNRLGLVATVSSPLGVSFTVVSGPASITSGTNLSFTGYGEVSLAAAQAGNENYSAAVSVTNSFNVSGPQLLVLGTNGVTVVVNGNVVSAAEGTDFGILVIGQNALTNEFVVKNIGNADAGVSGLTMTGPGSNSFELVAEPLFPAAVDRRPVSFRLAFKPISGGLQTAAFSIYYNGTNAPYVVNLAGIGLGGGIALASNELAYAATYAGGDPADQSVTLTNVGVSGFTYTNVIGYSTGASNWLTALPATGTVQTDGVATLTFGVSVTNVGAGTHTATNYVMAADATNSPQAVVVTLTVAKADQTISFPAIADQLTTNRVVLAATASSGLTPAFSVTSGPAVIIGLTSLTFTGAGSVSIVARQTGDTNWNAAVSVTNTFTVNLTDQAALPFTPASPQTYGTTNSLTVLVSSGIELFTPRPPSSGVGTGAVSYAVLSGSGAIVESNLLTVTSGTGSVVVVATKAADALYNARSATATVVCAKAGQVITFDAIDDQFWTNVVTLAATASSGLTLHLDVLSGPAAIDEAILSFSGYGEVSLAAAQAGNDNYSAAVSVTNSFNVSGPQLLVLGTNGVTVVVNGNVVSTAEGTDFGPLVIGQSALTNQFVVKNIGSANAGVSGLTMTGPGSNSFELVAEPRFPAAVDHREVSFRLAFKPISGGLQTAAFSIYYNGTNAPYVVNLAGIGLGGGIALASNELAYAATYAGGDPADQSVTLTNVGVSGFTYTNVIGYSAGASNWLTALPATGTVETDGVATLTFGVSVTNVSAGTHTATNYVMAADATNSPQAVVVTLTVDKADQAITFANPGDQLITNRLTLAGTASSGLPVSYEVQSGPADLSDLSNLTFTAGGTVVLVASQAGDSNWNGASNVMRSFTVWPVLTMAVDPAGTGDTTPAPGDHRVTVNVATAIQASAHAGYHFTGWTQAGGGVVAEASALSTTVTLNSNSLMTATFTLNVITALTDKVEVTVPEGDTATFQVKLSAQGTGDVVVAVAWFGGDNDLSVSNGASLTFTTANWATYQTVTLAAAEDNADNGDGSAMFAVTAAGIVSVAVMATEADDDYTLEVTHTNGSVKIRDDYKEGKNQRFYDNGTTVTLTAIPNVSYRFVEWLGDATGSDNPLALTMDGDKVVTAWFMPVTPLALPPRAIAKKAFTARWRWVEGGAPEGELSVASDAGFVNPVPGYEARYVCNATEQWVGSLAADRDYWYRVRRLTAWSGPSGWSKAVKVRTGAGLPVFTSLLCAAPVGSGSCQEFALTNLVAGSGALTVKSSDTNSVTVELTTNSLFLHYQWKDTGTTARIILTAKHPDTGYNATYEVALSEATGKVVVVDVGAPTNAGKRLAQEVTLENQTGGPVFGVRLRVDKLDNPNWVVNRSGFSPYNDHQAILEYPCVWPAGSQLVVRVVFHADYAKQARTRPVEYWAGAILPPLNGTEPITTALPIVRSAEYEDGGLWLLGLPALGNRWYEVLQSDDAGASWNTNAPAVRATANYLQWLDMESTNNRLYRVRDAGRERLF